jgi:NAD(P)-dependent dehydrogenase (short-subunit alcohol dehydrogenase family)
MSHTHPRVVVVTGASAGVGRAAVKEFAREGAKIGLIARGREALEETKAEVEALGGEALVLPLDVSDAGAVEEAAAQVEKNFGPIDVWVNDAMVSVFSPIKEMSPEEFKRVTEVTYLGYVYGSMAALKRMLPRDSGVIVQVSSALGFRSIPLQAAYCAAKHAIVGFSESLRTELLHDRSKVRVTLVHLPAVNTPQFGWVKSTLPRKPQPVPPIFQPEVPAKAIVFASKHPRKSIDVGYPTVQAISAEKFVPGIADRYLAKYGYDSQQTDEAANPDRPHNLWHSVRGQHSTHGTFDSRSKNVSWQLFLTMNRRFLVSSLVVGLAAGSTAAFFFRKKSRPQIEKIFLGAQKSA